MSNIKVKVGQQSAIKVVSSLSASPVLVRGITILDEGNQVGVSYSTFTLNFTGAAVDVTLGDPGVANINISNYFPQAGVSSSVIGGIASVSTLSVSGISTLGNIVVGSNTLRTKVGNLTIQSYGSEVIVNDNLRVSGILTVSEGIYYTPGNYYSPNGVAYFDNVGKIVSSGNTSFALSETNYILTTNNVGDPVWSDTFDGGVF